MLGVVLNNREETASDRGNDVDHGSPFFFAVVLFGFATLSPPKL